MLLVWCMPPRKTFRPFRPTVNVLHTSSANTIQTKKVTVSGASDDIKRDEKEVSKSLPSEPKRKLSYISEDFPPVFEEDEEMEFDAYDIGTYNDVIPRMDGDELAAFISTVWETSTALLLVEPPARGVMEQAVGDNKTIELNQFDRLAVADAEDLIRKSELEKGQAVLDVMMRNIDFEELFPVLDDKLKQEIGMIERKLVDHMARKLQAPDTPAHIVQVPCCPRTGYPKRFPQTRNAGTISIPVQDGYLIMHIAKTWLVEQSARTQPCPCAADLCGTMLGLTEGCAAHESDDSSSSSDDSSDSDSELTGALAHVISDGFVVLEEDGDDLIIGFTPHMRHRQKLPGLAACVAAMPLIETFREHCDSTAWLPVSAAFMASVKRQNFKRFRTLVSEAEHAVDMSLTFA